jgi:hypothetical protein
MPSDNLFARVWSSRHSMRLARLLYPRLLSKLLSHQNFPPCATFCREHLQQRACAGGAYSITSSARARSVGGMLRPSIVAVVRFMISSKFVDCSDLSVDRVRHLH